MKLTLALAAVAALSLAACTPDPTLISQAQQAAMLTCAFLPTAETVANILAAKNSSVTTAEQVASAICAAVTNSGSAAIASTQPAALMSNSAGGPQVFGVPIHGRFVGLP